LPRSTQFYATNRLIIPIFYTDPAFSFRMKIKGELEKDGNRKNFTEQQNFACNNHVRCI